MTENGSHDKKKSGGENSTISTEKPVYLKKGNKRKRKLSKPFEEEPPKSLANIRDKGIDSSSSKVHIFREDHTILRNLHLTFVLCM